MASRLGRAWRRRLRSERARTPPLIGVEALEGRRLLAAGGIDRAFGGGDGKVIGAAGSAGAVFVQGDGKILVGQNGPTQNTLARLNGDGTRDRSFGGGDGLVPVDFGINAIAVDRGGRIVAAGESGDQAVVARFGRDGRRETGFDDGGRIVVDAIPDDGDASEWVADVEVLPDGDVYVAGTAFRSESGEYGTYESATRFAVRYDADGSRDRSFGDGGVVSQGESSTGNALAVLVDGDVVVAGDELVDVSYRGPDYVRDWSFTRYSASGDVVDQGQHDFDDWPSPRGTDDRLAAVVATADGGFLLAGSVDGGAALVRYRGVGRFETSFGGGDGVVTGLPLSLSDAAVQADGKIVLVGSAERTAAGRAGNWDFIVARLRADGSPDDTFGGDGFVATDFEGFDDFAGPMAIQRDGKVVAAGRAGTSPQDSRVAVARYLGDSPSDGDTDDRMTEAVRTSVGRTLSGRRVASARDVDLYRLDLKAFQRVGIDVDGAGGVDTYLRVFDAHGHELDATNNRAAPGEKGGADPYIEFLAPEAGTYYVGVSAYPNKAYDPDVGDGDVSGQSMGTYSLSITDRTPPPPKAVRFHAARTLPVFLDTESIAAGDFNRDGRLDLVTSHRGFPQDGDAGEVSVRLGRGDGTFGAAAGYLAGIGPERVWVADVNGDGRDDLIVRDDDDFEVAGDADTVWTLLGRGDGTFAAAVDGGVGRVEAVGDFNGDGRADVLSRADDDVRYRLRVSHGRADGRFGAAATRALPGEAFGLWVADLNGDGRDDVAAGGEGAALWTMLGRAGGGLGPAVRHAVAGGVRDAAAADFDRDGDADLALSTFADDGTDSVWLMRGRGDGRLAAPEPLGRTPGGGGAPLLAGDFNGDGRPDLAAGSTTVTAWAGRGDGTFAAPRTFATKGLGPAVVGDFNRDGRDDIALSGGVLVPGDRRALLVTAPRVPIPAWLFGDTPSAAAGDFNRDGVADLATLGRTDTQMPVVTVLPGRRGDTFGAAATTEVPGAVGGMAAADFDRDGRLDLAVTASDPQSGEALVRVLRGRGDGTFAAVREHRLGVFGNLDSLRVVEAGDFDLDGKVDLALGAWTGDGPGNGVRILNGRGDGTFRRGALLATTPPAPFTSGLPRDIAVADLNRDGRGDVVVAHGGGAEVFVARNDGTFARGARLAALDSAASVAVGDFDRDARADVLTAGWEANRFRLALHPGRGDGTFRASTHVGRGAWPMTVADFNGDGLDDVAAGSAVVLGRGDGAFAEPVGYDVGAGTPVAGDFDGDGRLDWVVVGQGEVVVVRNGG